MVKRYFIALSLFIIPFVIQAQDERAIDSLKSVIEEAKHDTLVCSAYLSWGMEFYLNSPDTALVLWQKAHEIAKDNLAQGPSSLPDRQAGALEKKYLSSLADALNNIGYIYHNQGDITKALEYFHKSSKILEEIGNKKGIASSLTNIGVIYYNQGDIAKGLEYFHKSLKIQEETRLPDGQVGDKKGMASSLNNIGGIYENQGDIPKALEYFHKSLKIREEIGNKIGIAISLNNIGYIYKNQGVASTEASAKEELLNKALEYYHKSLIIKKEIGDKKGIANSLNNIGRIYDDQGDAPQALEYFHKSLMLREEIGDKRGIAYSLDNIGGIELNQGKLTTALN